jgi:uncharacterized membrane protein YbhN (UPF0104 family)
MKRLLHFAGMLARLGLALGVLAWLLHTMGIDRLLGTLRGLAGNWPLVAASLALVLAPLVLVTARWKCILDSQDMRLPWTRVGRIFLIGHFFNAFMIGPTGGDIVKAYYVARETRQRKTEAVTSVFIDRVVGLLVLAVLVAGVIVVRWDFYAAHPATRSVALAALAACAMLIVGAALAFGVQWFDVWPALRRWQTRPFIGGLLVTAERAYNAFYICRSQPRLLITMAAYSLATQLLLVGVSACMGLALDLPLAFKDYLAIAPLVGLISAIPVTPGGVGIREGANIHLLAALGVSADKAFMLAFLPYCFMVLWGLPGGILFLLHRPAAGHSMAGEMADAAPD